MFLRSLALRGFKSFADKTTLDFEPGITVIVGPNGSGKSNVVDALVWVLGSQSPKGLRGGSMADVIFAGAPGRPALGRAAVEITIDNGGGTLGQQLPIDFSEVTVGRAMFASGETSYAINGADCRALDVAELLSDTGLGRETHTIVGQGQLDAILNAKPEERRAFVEEAAGILKHRRRKERALRKLAQMDAHVERLSDVLRELRRGLRPLERQAEAAAKHATLQAALRDVRLARAVRELDRLDRRYADDTSRDERVANELAEHEAALTACREAEAAAEQALAALAPRAHAAGETHFALANLTERLRGLGHRVQERRRGLSEAVEEPVAGRDPATLRTEAARQRVAQVEADAERAAARAGLESAEATRRGAEQARRAHEQAAAAEARRRSEARERLLRWEGQASAVRSGLAQAAGEEGRLAGQLSGVQARRGGLASDQAAVQKEIERLDTQTSTLAGRLGAAERRLRQRQVALDRAAQRERELERRRASLEARADALHAASQEAAGGTAALAEAAADGAVVGVVGPLADHLRIPPVMSRAVAAALGPLGDALVVSSPTAASEAIGFVRSAGSGRVVLLVSGDPRDDSARPTDLSDLGAAPLADCCDAEPGVQAALRRALAGFYVVDDLLRAAELANRFPGLGFVTEAGEVAGPRGWAGGSASAASAVLSRAAAQQAEAQVAVVGDELLRAHRQVADAARQLAEARQELDAASATMQESDGLITAAADRLRRLGKELTTSDRELTVLQRQQTDLAAEIAGQRERLAELERRGVEPVVAQEAGPDLEAERLDDALASAREQEVQARLAVSEVSQRLDEVARRAGALEREADDVERQLVEREARRRWRLDGIVRCDELAEVASVALERAERSSAAAASERDGLEQERAAQQGELGVIRSQAREQEATLGGLREVRHREDLARQELRLALDGVRARLRDELGAHPDAVLAEARTAADGTDGPLGGGEARDAELEEEEERLIRKVGLLGTINPLAQEEFAQLTERHAFLVDQLADLEGSKADLMQVVEAVDARIRELFGTAFADVAMHFERIFARLFPGGEGRLVLDQPDDLLASGVEVEARPPGKRIKRLSLLSGGERSLTALAVLFAIFAARPSPFYVLDEVEAALDDVNLQRLLGVIGDFRATSQLIVITHQKRTMEIADSLYGVTMQRDGVSKVVSQRLTEAVPASA